MPTIQKLDVDVDLGVHPQGVYANAFRVIQTEHSCFLDFLVYSPTENRAYVIARLKVDSSMVPVLRDQMTSALSDQAVGVLVVGAG